MGRRLETDERDIPFNKLFKWATDVLPAIAVWPDRAYPVLNGTPPAPGIWRGRPAPDGYVGWPVALYVSHRVAGTGYKSQATHEVNAHAARIRAAGIQTDMDFTNAADMASAIYGIVVPYQSQPIDALRSEPAYRDPAFPAFWWPFAQIWKLPNPVAFPKGSQGIFYVQYQYKRAVLDGFEQATRIL